MIKCMIKFFDKNSLNVHFLLIESQKTHLVGLCHNGYPGLKTELKYCFLVLPVVEVFLSIVNNKLLWLHAMRPYYRPPPTFHLMVLESVHDSHLNQ